MVFARRNILKLAVVASAAMLAGCATETPQRTEGQLRAAETTLANFQSDPNMTWLRNNIGRARGIVISPRITRGGFILGGSGGEAIVLARDPKTGSWAGPAFYNMGTASFGLQAGVDVSEIVMLVMTEKALDALLSRNVKLGADASIAAGPVGTAASSTVNADMIAFSRAKGVFAGIALDGASINPDAKANAAFYGRDATPADILVRQSVTNPSAAGLKAALGRR